jgi:hypothetical protein
MRSHHVFLDLPRIAVFIWATNAVLGCGAPPASTNEDIGEVVSFHDEGLIGNALTRTEVITVLGLVDAVCGDTWCEGDNDFRFRHLFCEATAGTCSLMFQIAARDGSIPPRWRWQMCRTSGFTGFDSLVDTSPDGDQWLTDRYYEALNACIDRLEHDESTAPTSPVAQPPLSQQTAMESPPAQRSTW